MRQRKRKTDKKREGQVERNTGIERLKERQKNRERERGVGENKYNEDKPCIR